MHPKYLRKYTLIKIRNIVVWFIISIAMIGGISLFASTTKLRSEQALAELRTKEASNTAIKAKLNIANTALMAWQDVIKKEHSDRSGLKVKVTQKTIEQLKQTYRIGRFSIGLSNPEKRTDIVSKFVDVSYSNVTLNFSAYTDIDAILFVNSLTQQMPGHVVIRSIDITGLDAVDKTVLLNLSGGQDPSIVLAKVELVWQDMQDKIKHIDVDNKNQPPKK